MRKHKGTKSSCSKWIGYILIVTIGIIILTLFVSNHQEQIIRQLSEDKQKTNEINTKNDVQEINLVDQLSVTDDPILDQSDRIHEKKNKKSYAQLSSEIKGVYIAPGRLSNMDKVTLLIKELNATQVNAVVIDVKNDYGNITFKTEGILATKLEIDSRQIGNIEEVLNQFHQNGIYVIGRVVAFRDNVLPKHRPDMAIKNKDGTIFYDRAGDSWLNPFLQETCTYIIEIAEYAAFVGFDEIQFDYVRFSTQAKEANVDFGGNRDDSGKIEAITGFVKEAVEDLHKRDIPVSADVFGTIINSKIDAETVGQDYVELSRYLDYISPMIYPSHYANGCYGLEVPDLQPYELIVKALIDSNKQLEELQVETHRAIVRPWLQDFTASWLKSYQKYGSKQVKEQIQGVYDAGYTQWLLWNSSGRYSID